MAEEIYRAYVSNVKELEKHRTIIVLLANRAIKENKEAELGTLTKVYALLYSAYVEDSFLKLIHTPKALTENEIMYIQRGHNLEEKWKKCVELAFMKLNNRANSGEVANKKKTLNRILDKYIIAPSQMRNKIAHGQWMVCLNSDCTKINEQISKEIKQLDLVKVDQLFSIYKKFQQCILDLLVSPKTHYRDYYANITELERYIKETESWTLETKKEKILSSSKYKHRKSRYKSFKLDSL